MKGKLKLIDLFPEIAREWDVDRNLPLKVEEVNYGKKVKVWWNCPRGHQYQCRIDQKTNRRSGCPICTCNRKTQPVSITHPHLIEEWHPNNKIKPEEITSGSQKKILWMGKCGHEWESFLHNRTSKQANKCPYCAKRYVDQTNSLQACYPEIASEWHKTKNSTTPDKIICSSNKRAFWLGKCGHEWECAISTRTRKVRPTGCPVCGKSKGELAIEYCLNKMQIVFECQKRFSDCRSKKPLPFDFFVKDSKILIEFQGLQHFEPVDFGGDYKSEFKKIKKRDKIKKDWCKKNKYKLISIPYWDIEKIDKILEKEIFYG
jgi:hypothetical protein